MAIEIPNLVQALAVVLSPDGSDATRNRAEGCSIERTTVGLWTLTAPGVDFSRPDHIATVSTNVPGCNATTIATVSLEVLTPTTLKIKLFSASSAGTFNPGTLPTFTQGTDAFTPNNVATFTQGTDTFTPNNVATFAQGTDAFTPGTPGTLDAIPPTVVDLTGTIAPSLAQGIDTFDGGTAANFTQGTDTFSGGTAATFTHGTDTFDPGTLPSLTPSTTVVPADLPFCVTIWSMPALYV